MTPQVLDFGGDGRDRTADLGVMNTKGGENTLENTGFRGRHSPHLGLFRGAFCHSDGHFPVHRRRRVNPWSAQPRLFAIPGRISAARRGEHLQAIESRCEKTSAGCWLYPAVRDEAYPYLDVTGDDGGREQWSARRYVWALVNGDIPEGGIILGRCPPKACVFPAHQWLWVPPKQLGLQLEVTRAGDDSTARPHAVRQRMAGEAAGEPGGAWDYWRPYRDGEKHV